MCQICNACSSVDNISHTEILSDMTDWDSLVPAVSRLVCEDEVSGLAVNKKHIICQFWIQPEIAVFSRYSLELVRYGRSLIDDGNDDPTIRLYNLEREICIF